MKTIHSFCSFGTVVTSALIFLSQLSYAQTQTASDYSAKPPFVTDTSDPVVVINLSVELTQQAEAYTDADNYYVDANGVDSLYCSGRSGGFGICYSSAQEYIGYFDANKCYEYVTVGSASPIGYTSTVVTQVATGPELDSANNRTSDFFRPVNVTSTRSCSGDQFSGNFMNWATMTALDSFRYAMVGGARLVDTIGASAQTLLTRAHRYGDWSFVTKRISSLGYSSTGTNAVSPDTNAQTYTTLPSTVTPFANDAIVVNQNYSNNGNRVRFETTGGTVLGEYSVIVEVCNPLVGLEDNCVEYTDGTDTWYKPEGVMQRNALGMRFALLTYTGQDGNQRNGGVLRSNAKYIGYYQPLSAGGVGINPNAETNLYGQHVFDADCILSPEHTTGCSKRASAFSPGDGGVKNSGIINYINSFGLSSGGYKINDPVGELFYEGFRYLATQGADRVPVPEYYDATSSPLLAAISGESQKDNFPIITTWDDPVLHQCQVNYMINVGDQFAWGDNSLPGSTVSGSGSALSSIGTYAGINVDTLTDTVGTLEGYYGGTLGGRTRGRDNNGWLVAGLAYYAKTNDIRTDFDEVQTIKSFFVDTQEYNASAPQKQNNPLWLAAKYGGFDDANADNDPNDGVGASVSTLEWDANNDGDPDAYTLASQPANLIRGLEAAFNEITSNVSASSSAAVSTNSSVGESMIVQGLFKPIHYAGQAIDNRSVEWVGILQSLFLDEYNNFREDSDGDGAITDNDTVILFDTEELSNNRIKGVFYRYTTTDGGKTVAGPDSGPYDIDSIDSIWNARNELGKVSDVVSQRVFSSSASLGRYIFTGVDANADNQVTSDETVSFATATSNTVDPLLTGVSNYYRYLGLDSTSMGEANDIINYIRGEDNNVAGYRSRTLDYDPSNPGDEVWRLGDIVSSSPLIVTRPNESFNTQYRDVTYANFRNKYIDRRHMVYTGANDGMLHAFNAGFYDPTNRQFLTSLQGETAHPLGSELWAYVPYNLLPHLQWLTQLDYPHVFYVDGIPQSFDVNIFDDNDEDHPGGWGTILVVGMAFGGGEYTLDPDSDTDGDLTDDITLRSAYMIFDITNPEKEPKLIAEVTHPLMGYTNSRPTIIKSRAPNTSNGSFSAPSANKWYLAFGSGPYGSDSVNRQLALKNGVSDQTGKVFIYDLEDKAFEVFGLNDYIEISEAASGFIGDFSVADWNNDYIDDVLYFGTVRGALATPEGDLMRLVLSFDTDGDIEASVALASSKLLSSNGANSLAQPFMSTPLVNRRPNGDKWIYAGSGRFLVNEDALVGKVSGTYGYYGVKEPEDSNGDLTYATVPVDGSNSLIDTTDVVVLNGGGIKDANSGAYSVTLENSDTVGSFTQLVSSLASEPGWNIRFDDDLARQYGRSALFSVNVFFTEYVPTGLTCDPLGVTYINAVNALTGTATPDVSFDSVSSGGLLTAGAADDGTNNRIEYGKGPIRDVDLEAGQDVTGGLNNPGPVSALSASGRISWREILIE